MRTRSALAAALASTTLTATALLAGTGPAAAVPALGPGQSLRAGASVSDGPDRLLMQADGNLVSVYEFVSPPFVRWHSGTHGAPGARAVMQGDGNLVVVDAAGRPRWDTTTSVPGSRLDFERGGDLVVRTPDGQVDWSAAHWGGGDAFNTLYAQQGLQDGASLYAGRTGLRYAPIQATLQLDGNLVVVDPATRRVHWHAGTHGHPGARAVMQPDGNLVVYDAEDRPLWHAGTHGHRGARAVVQEDGNLVVYAADDRPLWDAWSARP